MAARAQRWGSGRRGEGGGGREVAEFDAGINGPRYDGMETGDARVGKLPCVEIRRSEKERWKGPKQVALPGHTLGGGRKKGGAGLRIIDK